jgi:large subunit ribosomal protein L25
MQTEINAEKRTTQGRGASRRLRHASTTPAIVYGAGKPPEMIQVDHKTMMFSLRHEAFHSSVLTLVLDGAKQSVLLRDVQMHPVRPQILHLDFLRVDAAHKIHVKVPLHFVNADIAPGVKLAHGVVSHVFTELDVQCLPGNLPEFITVDLANLEVGHSIHVADLALPEGVEPVGHMKSENPAVVAISAPRVGGEEAAPAATPAA